MEKTLGINVRLQSLLPLEDQADAESILHFAQAIQRETSRWIEDASPRFSPAVQVDFAVGPPRCCIFFIAAGDAEVEARKQQLVARLESLPVPRVCGLVAISTCYSWDDSVSGPVDPRPISLPFGTLMEKLDLRNQFEVMVRLYEQLRRSHPDYRAPIRARPLPVWYRRVWHVVAGMPHPPGYLRGTSAEFEIHEPLPCRPPPDWLDRPQLDAARQKTIAELQQAVAAQSTPMIVYALALKLYEQGETSAAIVQLDACLTRFPEAAELNFTRAAWSLENGKVQEGLHYSEKCVELAPAWAAGHYVRGHALMLLEAWEQAESDFARAAELHITKFDAWLRLARVRARRQDTDAALMAVDQALECNPYHPDALALRIELLPHMTGANDRPAEIMHHIDRDLAIAHNYSPPHPFFLTRRAERALSTGNPTQAIQDCDEALSLDANYVNALGLRGAAYLAIEDLDQAFLDLSRAIDLGSEAPAVLEARGRIYLQRGDLELARLDCERALAVDERFVFAQLTLAGSMLGLEDHAAALHALQTAAELAPKWDVVHRALGDFHTSQGNLAQAYACYCRAVDCGPEVAVNWLQRGTCQAQRNNVEKALFDLQKTIELDPGFAAAHRAKATLNLMRNDLDGAIMDLSEVLRLVPDDVVSRFQRAQCYLAKNQPAEAREDFDRVIQLSPTLAAAYSGRARTWIESGDEQRAAEDFREAVIQDPLRADDFEISRYLAEAAILQRAENYQAALQKTEAALQINRESAQAIAMRAACYWHDERLVEAAEDYTWLLERLAHGEEEKFKRLACLNNRGQVFVEMGEFEKGLADLDESIQLAETFDNRECRAYSLSGRALAHAGLDDFAKADADFQHSVDIRPENAWVYYNQGLVYDKMGNPREAAVCFNLALALDEPPLPPRKRQRAQAYVQRHAESEPN